MKYKKTKVYYNKWGDMIEVNFKNVGSYTEWINPHFEVLRHHLTNKIVGFNILSPEEFVKDYLLNIVPAWKSIRRKK